MIESRDRELRSDRVARTLSVNTPFRVCSPTASSSPASQLFDDGIVVKDARQEGKDAHREGQDARREGKGARREVTNEHNKGGHVSGDLSDLGSDSDGDALGSDSERTKQDGTVTKSHRQATKSAATRPQHNLKVNPRTFKSSGRQPKVRSLLYESRLIFLLMLFKAGSSREVYCR